MDISSIGIRYAKSLFLLAKEQQKLDEVNKDLKFIYNSFRETKEIGLFLDSPVVKESQKLKIIKGLFKDRIGELAINILVLAIRNKREMYIESICRNYFDFYKTSKGIKTVVITSAIPIESKTKQKMIDILKDQLKAEIDFTERVNEKILGGFILQIDGKQYDTSISHKLTRLKRELVKRK
ncbi:MAG: ATP synthase F1 subunit delta [Bacteroidales bacterium]|nr:ATP synthase F1 subunit delta [Bacteroidales bacterium]